MQLLSNNNVRSWYKEKNYSKYLLQFMSAITFINKNYKLFL